LGGESEIRKRDLLIKKISVFGKLIRWELWVIVNSTSKVSDS